jgi:hypothetical protein
MNIYIFSKIIDAMWESIYFENYQGHEEDDFDFVDYMSW